MFKTLKDYLAGRDAEYYKDYYDDLFELRHEIDK